MSSFYLDDANVEISYAMHYTPAESQSLIDPGCEEEIVFEYEMKFHDLDNCKTNEDFSEAFADFDQYIKDNLSDKRVHELCLKHYQEN